MKNSPSKYIPYIFVCLVMFLSNSLAFSQEPNFEEMTEIRKERQTTALWGPDILEDSSNNYTWQPETLSYTDSLTGKEVWVLTRQPDHQDVFSKEHGTNAWSNDGSRIGFFDFTTRTTNNPSVRNDRSSTRWIVNTDGSGLRATEGYGKYSLPLDGFSWGVTELAYYSFGSHPSIDAPTYSLCKMSLTADNVVSGEIIMDTSAIDSTQKEIVKDGVSNNDENIIFRNLSTQTKSGCANTDSSSAYFASLGAEPTVDSYWQVSRNIDDYSEHNPDTSELRFHDVWGPGILGDVMIGQYSGTSDFFAKFSAKGSCTSGYGSEPIYEYWDGDSFGNNEVMIISDGGYIQENPYGLPYFGHPTFDRWGKYALMGTYTDSPAPGTRILDMDSLSLLENYPLAKGEYDGQHHSWTGWTDYVIGVRPADMLIYANKYNQDADNAIAVVDTHHAGRMVSNYNGYPRPSQSPDGTKVAFAATWLNNGTDDYPYINWAVVYNPHPPEMISCSATEGVVTARFDWGTDQETSRGYTQRGWPDEDENDPPPPRETKLFRLWRSSDNSSWLPVGYVFADIFSRYDFGTGKWDTVKYWNITDEPGDGTWYYAVTSLEWSGLESQTLSNIYSITVTGGSGTGTQVANYPSDPGGDSNFYISFNSADKLTRYYNIYAEDGSLPSISKNNRVASMPISATTQYVDWLGNSDGSTEYIVTAVDYFGNESEGITPNVEFDTPTEGMYTLTWSGLGETVLLPGSTGIGPAIPSGLTSVDR